MGCCSNSNVALDSVEVAKRRAAWQRIRMRIPRKNTADHKERRAALFERIDTDNDGLATEEEIYQGLTLELSLEDFHSDTRGVVKKAFEAARLSKSQTSGEEPEDAINLHEFSLLLCYVYDRMELQVMFEEVDKSGDSSVNQNEFKKALPLIEDWGLKIPRSEYKAYFKRIDTDGSGEISFNEFASWAVVEKLRRDGDPDA